jgi:hypothetical protein
LDLNVDVQIQFPKDMFVPCESETEDNSIRVQIQEALQQNFATTVNDWKGTAVFGEFLFDRTQAKDNSPLGGVRRARTLRATGHDSQRTNNEVHRFLQEASCPARTVDCSATVADYCRWGCVGVDATDCGSVASSTKSWALLAKDVKSRLAGLGFQCLGLADQLNVVVTEPILAQL